MANTFQYINKVVLTTSATTVTFSSIPQTYTDLFLIAAGRSDVGGQGDGWRISYNGTNNTDSSFRMTGYSTTTTNSLGASDTSNNWLFTSGNTWTSNSFGSAFFWIPNYTSTTRPKLAIGESMWGGPNVTSSQGMLLGFSGGYASGINSSAITSFTITGPDSGGTNMLTGSTFYLYGITKA